MGKRLLIAAMLVAIVATLMPAAVMAQVEGSVYTIQKDDWLSKLADKEYGDPYSYWSIYYYNNLMAVEDSTLAYIEAPDLIEVSDSLYLPSAEEVAEAPIASPALPCRASG